MTDTLPASGKAWAVTDTRQARLKSGLFNAACFGWRRPAPGTQAGDVLDGFTTPGHQDYDAQFTEDLRVVRASWLPEPVAGFGPGA